MDWKLSDQELTETTGEILKFSERLRSLPMQARQVLTIIVKRSVFNHADGLHIPQHELTLATGADNTELREVLDVLDKYGFIQEGFPDQMNRPAIQVAELEHGWNFVNELKEYCRMEDIELSELLVDLNFSLLD